VVASLDGSLLIAFLVCVAVVPATSRRSLADLCRAGAHAARRNKSAQAIVLTPAQSLYVFERFDRLTQDAGTAT